MAKASPRRTPLTPVHPPVLRLIPRLPPPPLRHNQEVADGLSEFRSEALLGKYVGVLVAGVLADGSIQWNAYGTVGGKDTHTCAVSSNLCAGVYRDCWTGA
jgi:hypothetical protein